MESCAAGFYLLVLLNGLPFGEICTSSAAEPPVAAIVRAVHSAQEATAVDIIFELVCPRTGTIEDLATCEPKLTARRSSDVLRINYASGR